MPINRELRPHLCSLLFALVLLAGCASTETPVLERLDPLTGVTITRASSPLVMYRDMSAQSAFGREYVYVGPVQVNNMGDRQHYLWLGIWGTSDVTNRNETMNDFETIVVYADGEPLSLEVRGWNPGSIGASDSVYVKPVAAALDGYYRVTIDQMRLIAESQDLEIRAGVVRPKRFFPWDSPKSSQDAIVTFLRNID